MAHTPTLVPSTGSFSALLQDLRRVIDQMLLLCAVHDGCGEAPTSAPDLAGLYPGNGERERILAALTECRGNQTLAAKLLGMSRRTLVYRIERYGLPRPRKQR